MRIDHLRALILVAETGSISQAAEQLYISQQGLSRIISNLEAELDIPLFTRSNNRIHLTEAGTQTLFWARRIEEDYLSLNEELRRCRTSGLGCPGHIFTIYATPIICITILPRIVGALKHIFPSIHFNIIEKLPPEIVSSCTLDATGMAILSIAEFLRSPGIRQSNPSWRFDEFFHDRLMLSVSRHSPTAQLPLITTEELASIPLALHNTELNMVHHLLGEGREPNVLVHTTNFPLCREIVSQGSAAGLSSALLDYYHPCENTVLVPLEKEVTFAYGCLYNGDIPADPVRRELLRIVRTELSRCENT